MYPNLTVHEQHKLIEQGVRLGLFPCHVYTKNATKAELDLLTNMVIGLLIPLLEFLPDDALRNAGAALVVERLAQEEAEDPLNFMTPAPIPQQPVYQPYQPFQPVTIASPYNLGAGLLQPLTQTSDNTNSPNWASFTCRKGLWQRWAFLRKTTTRLS